LALKWRLIDRVPRMRLLSGEKNRDFIFSHDQENEYITNTPQPLSDFVSILIDTGLRPTEALSLTWSDVFLEPANGSKFGYVRMNDGKAKYARRNVSLTQRARETLAKRQKTSKSPFIFANGDEKKPFLLSSLDHMHSKLRGDLHLPKECVLYSFRHTFGTRLGEADANAFEIMKRMGHSSVTVSQRYIHPTPESMENAIRHLEAMNCEKRHGSATVSATLKTEVFVTH
jgi:integrase